MVGYTRMNFPYLAVALITVSLTSCASLQGSVYERDSLSVSISRGDTAHFHAYPRDGTIQSGTLDCSEDGGFDSLGGFSEYVEATPGASIGDQYVQIDDISWQCADGVVHVSADSFSSILDVLSAGPRSVGGESGWPRDILTFTSRITYKYPEIGRGKTIVGFDVGVGRSNIKFLPSFVIPRGTEVYVEQEGEVTELFRVRDPVVASYDASKDVSIYVDRGESAELTGWSHVRINREKGTFMWRYQDEPPDFLRE